MNKNGFTLAEVTIVLVVIGMLVVMAIKGSDIMVTSSEMREIGTINKMHVAATTAFGRGGIPDNMSAGLAYLDMDYFFDEGFLQEHDLVSKLQKGYEWIYIPCAYRDPSTSSREMEYDMWHSTGYTVPVTSVLICVTLVQEDNYNIYGLGDRLACVVERDLDDQDLFRGYGRMRRWAAYYPNITDFGNCRDYPVFNANRLAEYGYRVY